jgi:hypothetical protein
MGRWGALGVYASHLCVICISIRMRRLLGSRVGCAFSIAVALSHCPHQGLWCDSALVLTYCLVLGLAIKLYLALEHR